MLAFEIHQTFGLDHLTAVERPKPQPGPRQVLLKMKAASLNYRDILMVSGRYNPKQPLPLIPCSDGVGEVVEVGEGANRFRPGDRVATLFSQKWFAGSPTQEKIRATLGGPLDGTLAEYMVLDEDGVSAVPSTLTDVEAATLPCAALTAWSALVTQGTIVPGDTILVQGTGGVSLFAAQIANALGARVILTSSSDAKLESLRQHLDIWAAINYRTDPDWGKTARKLTDGDGVDHVVEVGGAGTLAQSCRAIRIGGHISLIGVLSGHSVDFNILPVVMQNVRIQGILVGSKEGFETMCRSFECHQLKPIIDRVFPFDEAREAMVYMSGGRHVGKVCIEF